MKLINYIILISISGNAIGQTLTNDGAAIHIQNQAQLTVIGDLQNNPLGTFDNSGLTQVSGDVVNDGQNTLFVNGSPGEMELNGNHQIISGTDSILFYELSLTGANGSLKELYQNIGVTQSLNLNNQELQLHQNNAHVVNPSVSAVTFNQGFVSGDSLGGALWRTTNSTQSYVFPVGDANLSPILRPVIIEPNDASVNVFSVRMSPLDAGADYTGTSISGATGPFDKNLKVTSLGTLNDNFYHNVLRNSGSSPATMSLLYSSLDGDFKTLAQWKGGQFVEPGFVPVYANDYGLDVAMQKTGMLDFDQDVFVLSEVNFIIVVPGGVSVNADGLNDVLYIDYLEYYPANELAIYNRWGDLVFQEAPYQNEWNGNSNVAGVVGGSEVVAGTYYYLLKLTPESDPMTGYIELKK